MQVADTAQYRSVLNWQLLTIQLLEKENYCYYYKVSLIFEWSGLSLLGPFLAMPLGSSKLTSNDLPGPSEIHQGLSPYGPRCSYATGYNSTRCAIYSTRGRFCFYHGQNRKLQALPPPSAIKNDVIMCS